jgi:polysaccharide export outer membrane protein
MQPHDLPPVPHLLPIVPIRQLATFLGLLLTFGAQIIVAGQSADVISGASNISRPVNSTDDDKRYRIGAGDVLDIKVFRKPQFDREGVRVDPRGMIRIPLIKVEIRAACRTEDELAAEITTLLKEYVREPEVIVQIKEYQAEPVAVLGAVRTPSRFQLQRRVRLLELMTFVNGPADNAGPTIQVVHMGTLTSCETASTAAGSDDKESLTRQVDYYKLTETLRGYEKANPYVSAGDVISIAKADEVYVVGNVVRPSAIPLNEPITVSRAIAMAGGTLIDSKKTEIHIVRQLPGSTEKKEILVNLEAINRHKAEDIVVVANDIIEVPASGGKRFLRSLLGAVVPAVTQLPVKVIP